VIANADGVGQRFELERVFCDPVARRHTRNRSEREHEMIVGQRFLTIG